MEVQFIIMPRCLINTSMNRTIGCLTRLQLPQKRLLSSKFMNTGYKKGDDLIEVDRSLMNIRGYGERAFQVNEVYIQQSVILFNKTLLAWNAKTFDDINEDSLALIPLIFPTPEILIIGTGSTMPRRLPVKLLDFMRSKGISVEACTTPHAAGTFNILNAEGRNVVAALLTLQPSIADE